MRITIEIPDDQVPPSYRCDHYPSGYAENNIHDIIINFSVLYKKMMLCSLSTQTDIEHETYIKVYKESCNIDIDFLRLLQQNMKIESGNSKEKILIDGLTEVVKDWYDGCPKSMIFVSRTLKLLKTYKENS